MNACFAKEKLPEKSRDYCEFDIDNRYFYQVPVGSNYIRAYAGKIAFGVIKNETRDEISTQKGRFFRVPLGKSRIKLADFVIFEKNYYYGKPSWR